MTQEERWFAMYNEIKESGGQELWNLESWNHGIWNHGIWNQGDRNFDTEGGKEG